MTYVFLPYDPIFPELFEKEKSYLQKIFGYDVTIEHFGSTSVPGLGGKGIIDIYILVAKNKIKSISSILAKNGYTFSEFFKDKDHLLYQVNKKHKNKKYHYHIHMSPHDNSNFKNCLIFRDYLRSHPDAVEKYIQLKKSALTKIKKMRNKDEIVEAYLKIKRPIIDNIIKQNKN